MKNHYSTCRQTQRQTLLSITDDVTHYVHATDGVSKLSGTDYRSHCVRKPGRTPHKCSIGAKVIWASIVYPPPPRTYPIRLKTKGSFYLTGTENTDRVATSRKLSIYPLRGCWRHVKMSKLMNRTCHYPPFPNATMSYKARQCGERTCYSADFE